MRACQLHVRSARNILELVPIRSLIYFFTHMFEFHGHPDRCLVGNMNDGIQPNTHQKHTHSSTTGNGRQNGTALYHTIIFSLFYDNFFSIASFLKFRASEHGRCRLIDQCIDDFWYSSLMNGTCTSYSYDTRRTMYTCVPITGAREYPFVHVPTWDVYRWVSKQRRWCTISIPWCTRYASTIIGQRVSCIARLTGSSMASAIRYATHINFISDGVYLWWLLTRPARLDVLNANSVWGKKSFYLSDATTCKQCWVGFGACA